MGTLEQAILAVSASPEKRTDVFALYGFIGMMAASLGALAAGLPTLGEHYLGMTPLSSLRLLFLEYAATGS